MNGIEEKLDVLIKKQVQLQEDIQNLIGMVENPTSPLALANSTALSSALLLKEVYPKVPVQNYAVALTKFLSEMGNRHQNYLDTFENMKCTSKLIVTKGSKYDKIIDNESVGAGKNIVAFINKTTGDIMKPASWKIAAKHPRGNIFDADHGAKALDAKGNIRYLK